MWNIFSYYQSLHSIAINLTHLDFISNIWNLFLFLKDLKAHLDFVPHEAMLGLPPLLDAQTSMVDTTRDTQRGQSGGHTLSLFPRGAVHNRGPFKLIIPPEIADSKWDTKKRSNFDLIGRSVVGGLCRVSSTEYIFISCICSKTFDVIFSYTNKTWILISLLW
jgi:glutaredoxin-related protein